MTAATAAPGAATAAARAAGGKKAGAAGTHASGHRKRRGEALQRATLDTAIRLLQHWPRPTTTPAHDHGPANPPDHCADLRAEVARLTGRFEGATARMADRDGQIAQLRADAVCNPGDTVAPGTDRW